MPIRVRNMATLSVVWIIFLITWRAQLVECALSQRIQQHILLLIEKFIIDGGKCE